MAKDEAALAPIEPRLRCPASGSLGKVVGLLTVKALLTADALQRLDRVSHRFCRDASCDVVYFDVHGARYGRTDVQVPVLDKEPEGNRLVCYCFGESEAGIRVEYLATGRSDAGARVRAHIAAGRCACEVRNPRGACCLADVDAAVRRIAGPDRRPR